MNTPNTPNTGQGREALLEESSDINTPGQEALAKVREEVAQKVGKILESIGAEEETKEALERLKGVATVEEFLGIYRELEKGFPNFDNILPVVKRLGEALIKKEIEEILSKEPFELSSLDIDRLDYLQEYAKSLGLPLTDLESRIKAAEKAFFSRKIEEEIFSLNQAKGHLEEVLKRLQKLVSEAEGRGVALPQEELEKARGMLWEIAAVLNAAEEKYSQSDTQ